MIDDRQRPQPEEIELHQSNRFDIVFVELRDYVYPAFLTVQRRIVRKLPWRDHHAS